MYVCICNGHREEDIRNAVREGHRTVEEVYSALGGLAECGQCIAFAEDMLENMLRDEEAVDVATL